MRFLALFLLFCASSTLSAQRSTQLLIPISNELSVVCTTQPNAAFQAVSIVVYGKTQCAIRTQGSAKLTQPDAHEMEERPAGVSVFGPFYLDATTESFQFQVISDQLPDSVRVHLYAPLRTAEPTETLSPEFEEICPLPPALLKSDWCAQSGGCAPVSTPANTSVSHLIVHHSAGANTAASWTAVVNSIWDYHVNTNGWSDIGYNWLIAPNGKLYQGRADNITGAHFCGQNGNTMGICMIGTYSDTTITAAARETLINLLAWKCSARNIDPTKVSLHGGSGLNLDNISGHRDGCSTECPGEVFHATFPALRQAVATRLTNCAVSSVHQPIQESAQITSAEGVWSYILPENVHFPVQIMICNALGQIVSDRQHSAFAGAVCASRGTGVFYYRIFGGGQELGSGSFFSGE
jgi:hypothetical protein